MEMTPDEQRTQTKLANLQRENTHRNCTVEIKQAGPHWGLYCSTPTCKKMGSWISWIKQDSFKAILKKQ